MAQSTELRLICKVQADMSQFYPTYNRLLAKYNMIDAFFYHHRQRIFVSSMRSGFFSQFENWVGLQKTFICFIFVHKYDREGARLLYDYYSQYNVSKDVFYLPFNWYTRRLVYWDSAAQSRGLGGSYYNIFSCGYTPIAWVHESGNTAASGGSTLVLQDGSGNRYVKHKPDGTPIPAGGYNVQFPVNFSQLIYQNLPNKTSNIQYQTNIDDTSTSNYVLQTEVITSSQQFNNDIDLVVTQFRDPSLPFNENSRLLNLDNNVDYIQSAQDAFLGFEMTAIPIGGSTPPPIPNTAFSFQPSQRTLPPQVGDTVQGKLEGGGMFSFHASLTGMLISYEAIFQRPNPDYNFVGGTPGYYFATNDPSYTRDYQVESPQVQNVYSSIFVSPQEFVIVYDTAHTHPFDTYSQVDAYHIQLDIATGNLPSGDIAVFLPYNQVQQNYQFATKIVKNGTSQVISEYSFFAKRIEWSGNNTAISILIRRGTGDITPVDVDVYKALPEQPFYSPPLDDIPTFDGPPEPLWAVTQSPLQNVFSPGRIIGRTDLVYPQQARVYLATTINGISLSEVFLVTNAAQVFTTTATQFVVIVYATSQEGAQYVTHPATFGEDFFSQLAHYENETILNVTDFGCEASMFNGLNGIYQGNYPVYESAIYPPESADSAANPFLFGITKYLPHNENVGDNVEYLINDATVTESIYNQLSAESAGGNYPYEFSINALTISNGIRMFRQAFNMQSYLNAETIIPITILTQCTFTPVAGDPTTLISQNLYFPNNMPHYDYMCAMILNDVNYSIPWIRCSMATKTYGESPPLMVQSRTYRKLMMRPFQKEQRFSFTIQAGAISTATVMVFFSTRPGNKFFY
jgi:hypothetical protein